MKAFVLPNNRRLHPRLNRPMAHCVWPYMTICRGIPLILLSTDGENETPLGFRGDSDEPIPQDHYLPAPPGLVGCTTDRRFIVVDADGEPHPLPYRLPAEPAEAPLDYDDELDEWADENTSEPTAPKGTLT